MHLPPRAHELLRPQPLSVPQAGQGREHPAFGLHRQHPPLRAAGVGDAERSRECAGPRACDHGQPCLVQVLGHRTLEGVEGTGRDGRVRPGVRKLLQRQPLGAGQQLLERPQAVRCQPARLQVRRGDGRDDGQRAPGGADGGSQPAHAAGAVEGPVAVEQPAVHRAAEAHREDDRVATLPRQVLDRAQDEGLVLDRPQRLGESVVIASCARQGGLDRVGVGTPEGEHGQALPGLSVHVLTHELHHRGHLGVDALLLVAAAWLLGGVVEGDRGRRCRPRGHRRLALVASRRGHHRQPSVATSVPHLEVDRGQLVTQHRIHRGSLGSATRGLDRTMVRSVQGQRRRRRWELG